MKVAIVHEWLVSFAGAEKVLAELIVLWPTADLFAIVDFLDDNDRKKIAGKFAKTTFVQRLPFAKKKYRSYLPFMPIAIEQIDLSSYDLIISNNHAVAKGVITGPDQLHISYVQSPIRYAWDLQHQYLQDSNLVKGFKAAIARLVLHYVRQWDCRTSFGVDYFVANSKYISRRIRKVYGRDSVVIHPPVDVESFSLCENKEDFYLTASRMVPYKKMPLIVEAFSKMPTKKLVVIGDGPDFDKAKQFASSNVSLLGYQSFEVLRSNMQRAKAFVFAAEEDFGIAPLEAQACGTPVIAFGRGGALDTVVGLDGKNPTGLFFHKQTVEGIISAISEFEALPIKIVAQDCRENAERFSIPNFRRRFKNFVQECCDEKRLEARVI